MKPDAKRTVAELKELRAVTGDENGAQRVAFTPTWTKARKWLRDKIDKISGLETILPQTVPRNAERLP